MDNTIDTVATMENTIDTVAAMDNTIPTEATDQQTKTASPVFDITGQRYCFIFQL